MPLPFGLVCDLLEQAHKLALHQKGCTNVICNWFERHRDRIDAHDTDLPALLSTLLPEKRTDRVYCIQSNTLAKIIGRAYLLGSSRIAELAVYKQPGLGLDLGDCVARILSVTPSPAYDANNQVTVEEIDNLLHALASRVKWSSPSIRASQSTMAPATRGDLETIYQRLSGKEAKWLTRLVLKNYHPLVLDPPLVYRLCDPILPTILRIQEDFTAAISALQAAKGTLLPNSDCKTSRKQLLSSIKPQLGVKVGRQPWFKGRSIKHCMDMGRGRRMSVEEKIDGEFCQIHIDLSKGNNCIQIFSKSGKDSTEDREALNGVILESLKINRLGGKLAKGCILEGELVVYHDLEQKVLPFHKIRKHVSRRGRWMNTEQDSLPGPYEHLMIIYYDILFLDNNSLLNLRHSERFQILSNLITCRKGYAELVQRQVIDFGHSMGASNLRKAFAKAILSRKEGLVLKPDDPYFDFHSDRKPFSSICIKLKKEYIGKFGDVGDFAVVGARYESAKAKTYNIPNLKWTHFHVGCLDNRDAVKRWNAKPEFTVVNEVELNQTMLQEVVGFANPMPVPAEENTQITLKIAPGIQQNSPLSVVFTKPLVFDLRCFNFDKVGNTGFWSLRFPTVTKVHFDRDFTDTVSFEQLQNIAKDATTAPEWEDSQENLEWIAKLEAADPRGIAVDTVSQLTMTTMPTPSPRRSTQSTSQPWSPNSPLRERTLGQQLWQLPSLNHQQNATIVPQPLTIGPPLATPPTSSLPTAKSPSMPNKPPSHKRKTSNDHNPTSIKRRRSGQTHTGRTHPRQQHSSPRREPLMDIAGNSQTPVSSFSSHVAVGKEAPGVEIIDLTSSPEPSFIIAVPSEEANSQASITTIEMPEHDGIDESDAASSVISEIGSSINIQPLRTRCRFRTATCSLARYHILVTQDVLDKDEARELLRDHGIDDPVTDLDKWLDTEPATSDDVTPPDWMLFVDSKKDPEEHWALMERLREKRIELLGDDRRLMEVHDWRMLRYLNIKENDDIKAKYYDGFQNPWRRWYSCSL